VRQERANQSKSKEKEENIKEEKLMKYRKGKVEKINSVENWLLEKIVKTLSGLVK
jgi:hypothetical protein